MRNSYQKSCGKTRQNGMEAFQVVDVGVNTIEETTF